MSDEAKALRIVAYRDGQETDITEGVKALYDLVLGSMDWGSGFWTADDAAPVAIVADACAFDNADQVKAYIGERTHEDEKHRFVQTLPPVERRFQAGVMTQHDHVWSSVGRCMWPGCHAVRSDG